MSDELKPCPFCKNGSNIKLVEYRPNCSGAVVCGQCGARGPKKKNDHERGWKAKAVEGWNTRAERTCRMKPAVGGGWYCSECHIWVAPDAMANATEHMAPRYCPSCGAKVVG